jgi:non-ribosomal peptide synthetase component E (peptide arylation enzyme)
VASLTTGGYDQPRPVPESVSARWRADGSWTKSTVSQAITAEVDPEAIAFVVDDQRHGFAAPRSRSTVLAATLRDHGVCTGDRVLIQLPNSAELIISIMGCWHLGGARRCGGCRTCLPW